MIILAVIFLVVAVSLSWAILVAFLEGFDWLNEKSIAKKLKKTMGRDVYKGGPLGVRTWEAFGEEFWDAFRAISGVLLFCLVLWLMFGDD